jgi:hypothetical protein
MKTTSIFFTLFITLTCTAQDFSLKVWPNGPPDSNGITLPEEISEGHRVKNVSEAEIFVYLPKKEINTGAAVVICPGGGYSKVTMGSEGFQILLKCTFFGMVVTVLA